MKPARDFIDLPLPTESVCRICGAQIDGGTICDDCAQRLAAEQSTLSSQSLEACGMPRRFAESGPSLQDCLTAGRLESGGADRVLKWTWQLSPWVLLLIGPSGTGKSALAAAIMRKLMNQWMVSRWVSCLDWAARCQDAIGHEGVEAEFWPVASSRAVLVFDDLVAGGDRSIPEWQRTMVLRLVDKRWRDELPTIITTNETGQTLAASYGQRLVDRLADGVVVKFSGKSFRGAER